MMPALRRDRHHEHVAVRDVGQLVGEHALELLGVEPLEDAGRDDHDRALR